jgi:hypothetical protein
MKTCVFAVGLLCGACDLLAGSVPYRVAAINGDKSVVLQVDMDSGEQVATPVPEVGQRRPWLLAARSDGVVFMIPRVNVVPPAYQWEWNTRTNEWSITEFPTTFSYTGDLEVTPSGNLIASDEWGLGEWDPEALEFVRGFPFSGAQSVEVDSTDRVITKITSTIDHRTSALLIQQPGTDQFDVLETGLPINDYALESDNSLIATVEGRLYRIDLEAGHSDLIYDDVPISQVQVAPDGRVVGSHRLNAPHEIYRIDLAAGTTETVTLDGTFTVSDMDILIIPEPSTLVLLLVGGLGAFTRVRRRQHRPAAECRR